MRRTDRLFELLQLFRDGRFHRGRDLADRLGVSLRTLYRDIDTLVASGAPIEGERGVGYMLRAPIFLPPLTLTAAELEALRLGVDLVARLGDGDLADAAARLKSKVEAVAPAHGGGDGTIELLAPAPDGPLAQLPLLRRAIRSRRKLMIDYERLDGTRSQRLIRPLHLEFWGRVWTVTAWCEMREGFRVFRIDRLAQANESDERFADDAGKSYADYLLTLDAKGCR